MSAKAKESAVHPTAVVDAGAKVAASAKVGPYAVVEAGAVIGENCVLSSHCVAHSGTILEEGVQVSAFAAIGGLPQDLKFDANIQSGVRVGKNTVIREGVTIHRSTQPNGMTTIGENCMLMTNSHVAHDCALANNVIMASGSLLAGHVHIGQNVFVGGGAAFHQFIRVGEGAIVGGLARISHDVPPYVMAAERDEAHGLNLIGLKRRGAKADTISELKHLYKATLMQIGDLVKLAEAEKATTPEGKNFLSFFTPSKRGYIRSAQALSNNLSQKDVE